VEFSGNILTGTPEASGLQIKYLNNMKLWTKPGMDGIEDTYISGDTRPNTAVDPNGTENALVFKHYGTVAAELETNGDFIAANQIESTLKSTYYVLGASGSELAVYNDEGEKLYSNLYAQGLVGRSDADGRDYYYLKDHLGSTRVTVREKTDGTGLDVIEACDYYPYGKRVSLIANGDVKTKQTFTGKEFDIEGNGANDGYNAYGIGQYYFGARYYDPEVGMWLTQDPMDQFNNPYQYVGNPTGGRVEIK
jgi:RHS repeat-associated protein